MSEKEEDARTFTEEQQKMFQNEDDMPIDTRAPTPGVTEDPILPGELERPEKSTVEKAS